MNKLLNLAWGILWHKYLIWDWHIIYGSTKMCKVIKVKNWRTAIIDKPDGQRETWTICPKILGRYLS